MANLSYEAASKTMIHKLTSHQTVKATIEEVWDFFSNPRNLNLITPPSLHFQILTGDERPMHNGQIIHYRIRILPLVHVKWVTEIKNVVELSSFIDEQQLGPYKFWRHIHKFVPTDYGIEIIDTVHYSIGFGFLGEMLHFLWIKRRLAYIFRYRKDKIRTLISSLEYGGSLTYL
ncbi:MAG: SRPBCC family protein [Desulfobacterales bacterium]|nr:SRPBCC family protein [Desulfobacterales bacterium]